MSLERKLITLNVVLLLLTGTGYGVHRCHGYVKKQNLISECVKRREKIYGVKMPPELRDECRQIY